MYKLSLLFCLAIVSAWQAPLAGQPTQELFSIEAVKSYPFPNELTASSLGSRIAWAFNEQGKRNIYVAEGPAFQPRKLTPYNEDDGQELTSVSISADGRWVVYVRGGDHGSNWDDHVIVNPGFKPDPGKVQIWSIPFAGGNPTAIGDGQNPQISPKGDVVAFVKSGQIWTTPIDGSSTAKMLFSARGSNHSASWSPDGSKLAFQSSRGDHSFIGVYTGENMPIQWLDPSFARDQAAGWSPDGNQLVFVRTPASGGEPDSILTRQHRPWQLQVIRLGEEKSKTIWKAPATLRGSIPTTHGGYNLHWAAAGRIVFLSYQDGWPHLYSIAETGGSPLLLTPGDYMAEHISLSPDGKWLLFSGNAGSDYLDIDRRHVVRVPVDKAAPEVMTPGDGLEWSPVLTGDGNTLAFISATPQRSPLPAVMPMTAKGEKKLVAAENIPATFPEKHLTVPRQVVFQSPDGFKVHATLFNHPGGPAKKPAIVYVHGGPPRQMLLGWHYSEYYSNAYAMNQYLASKGFVVISVNYRLGIGYGYEFHQPANAGTNGASEYIDIKAAGEWLAAQPFVDANKIGIYGGSYGGYLTAMALARDSKLFAAGVDIHGVHDRTIGRTQSLLVPDNYERAPDATQALTTAWQSSPISSIDTWTSPVLLIHADDDRNVRFSQSSDLVKRLEKRGIPYETLVVVDDTHHWMMHRNAIKVHKATAEFLERMLRGKGGR